jgi:hypothetical protein
VDVKAGASVRSKFADHGFRFPALAVRHQTGLPRLETDTVPEMMGLVRFEPKIMRGVF